MIVERMEVPILEVKSLDAAVKLFSDVMSTTFHVFGEIFPGDPDNPFPFEKQTTEHSDKSSQYARKRLAIDRRGFLELQEPVPPPARERITGIHIKVPNLDEAMAEMKLKGIRLLAEVRAGNNREAVYAPADLHGMMLCLVEYSEPTLVDALLAKPSDQGLKKQAALRRRQPGPKATPAKRVGRASSA